MYHGSQKKPFLGYLGGLFFPFKSSTKWCHSKWVFYFCSCFCFRKFFKKRLL